MADPRALFRSFVFPGSPEAFPPIERAPNGTRYLSVATDDGLELRAALVPSPKSGGRAAIFFHGNGESAAENLPFAAALSRDASIDVLLAEYRGYGGMPGSPSEEGLYRDADAAWIALVREGYASDGVTIIGRSLGTGVAVELASRGHGGKLLLVSPFTSITDVASRVVGPLAKMLMVDRFDSVSKISRIKVPITVIHGTRDEVVPFSLGETLARSVGAKLIPLEGRGHNDLFELPSLLAAELR